MPMWLKRLIRPLIPDRLMARYRLRQHSRQVRTNVDVLVRDDREVPRWLRVTPDTYRIGLVHEHLSSSAHGGDLIAIGDEADRLLAASLFIDTDAVVVAEVPAPRLIGRRRVEPAMRATAIVTTRGVAEEVGGVPGGDVVGFHRRIIDAGYRVRLVPRIIGEVDARRRDAIGRPVVVVLAAVPMHDIGGGSRGAQLAIEFVRRGFHVAYVSLFGSHESVDLGIRFVHPNLEQYRLDEFDALTVAMRASGPGSVVLEIPSPTFEPTVTTFQAAGWRLVYDVVDLWSDPSLGGDWYRETVEERLFRAADLVTASAQDLVDHARRFGADAWLIPNAVNPTVFGRDPGPLPHDFPGGDGPVFGYHGSLYGDWFSWTDLSEVALRYPSARIVLIGDVPAAHPAMPPNVHFLGLKPQGSLPDYLARFDVGLLAFVVSPMTHAVSPLKVFEYLACGVPVAAPPLRAVVGIPGVVTAERLVDAVDEAVMRPRPDRAGALRLHSWEERVGRLLSGLGLMSPEAGTPPRVVARPAIHYARGERRL